MSAEVYLFTGPNGVGKTTLIRSIVEKDPARFRHIQGSSVLKEYLGVTTYEELEQFDKEFKNEAAEIAISAVIRRAKESQYSPHLLIDAHVLFFDRGTITSSTTDWHATADGIVAVSADPSITFDRITKDSASKVRERSIFPQGAQDDPMLATAILAGYMEMNRRYVRAFCKYNDIPAYEIDNSQAIDQSTGTFLSQINARQ